MTRLWVFILLVCFVLVITFKNTNKHKQDIPKQEIPNFQHSGMPITKDSYAFVQKSKHNLLNGISTVMAKYQIRYVISHGNLIEFVRGRPIYHDDDIDIRFDVRDFPKWEQYCNSLKNGIDAEHNLIWDDRIHDFSRQRDNGIQARLISCTTDKIDSKSGHKYDVHCDVVASQVQSSFWNNYDLAFETSLRPVMYMGSTVYVPTKEKAHTLLHLEYGSDYMIPDRTYDLAFLR